MYTLHLLGLKYRNSCTHAASYNIEAIDGMAKDYKYAIPRVCFSVN